MFPCHMNHYGYTLYYLMYVYIIKAIRIRRIQIHFKIIFLFPPYTATLRGGDQMLSTGQ